MYVCICICIGTCLLVCVCVRARVNPARWEGHRAEGAPSGQAAGLCGGTAGSWHRAVACSFGRLKQRALNVLKGIVMFVIGVLALSSLELILQIPQCV